MRSDGVKRRIGRRQALAIGLAAGSGLLGACAEPKPEAQPTLKPYWEPAIQTAARTIELLRLFEVNSRALAEQSLTPERYAFAIESLSDQVVDLTERVISLTPPRDAVEIHPYLVGAADSLVDAVHAVDGFDRDARREHLVEAIAAIRAARINITRFTDAVGGGKAAEGLNALLYDLGDFEIIPTALNRHAVLVGTFDSRAEVRAKLRGFKDDAEPSIEFPHWVEVARVDHLENALTEEVIWIERKFETRIEQVADVSFRLQVHRPSTSASWKELIWLQQLDFDPSALAAAKDGSLFAAADRHGRVRIVSGQGDHVWSANAGIPTSSAAIAPGGAGVAVFGFDIVLLDDEGRPVWQRPFRPDNQLIEEAILTSNGFVIVRTTNASGTGRVFAYTPNGPFWGPTQDYIGAASVDVSSDAGIIAVGSTKDGVSQVILIQRDGNLAQRFGVDGEIRRTMLTHDARHTVVHSANGLVVYDNERGDFFADIPFSADFATIGSRDDTVFSASPRGVAAYSIAGSRLWFNDEVAPRSLTASDNFVCGLSSDTSVSVLRTNGEYVGEATTLTSIRAVALAPETDILAIASAERNVLAWQLPV
ncbi:MAG: hypothetical protein OXG46_03605 [Chloroflexi bacterium]|nr:hypothetical protein [Chloroflexota bacterium]MCY3937696.1 hypothetical protein [Chloroflexota bacterium]